MKIRLNPEREFKEATWGVKLDVRLVMHLESQNPAEQKQLQDAWKKLDNAPDRAAATLELINKSQGR